MRESMKMGAVFSDCRRYRYSLSRWWHDSLPLLVVIGLNPSTADETQDDPTIRRCIGYARSWGYGGLVMLNLFAYRATSPRDMKAAAEPVGPANDAVLEVQTAGRTVLCAWGAHGSHLDRARAVRQLLVGRDLFCLGTTKDRHPKHPLYLRADLTPVPYPAFSPSSARAAE